MMLRFLQYYEVVVTKDGLWGMVVSASPRTFQVEVIPLNETPRADDEMLIGMEEIEEVFPLRDVALLVMSAPRYRAQPATAERIDPDTLFEQPEVSDG